MMTMETCCDVLDTAKVRRLREKKGMSQTQAAIAAGFNTRQRWYEVESGHKPNVTIDTLNRIAAALGVRAKDLLK